MSERKNLRAGLLGLIMVLAIGGLTILANRNAPTPAPATPAAAQQPASVGLQSLAELNNSTPARRTDQSGLASCRASSMLLMSATRLSLKEVPKDTTSSSFSPISSWLRGSSLEASPVSRPK